MWGQGKEEFSAQDWKEFYTKTLTSNYDTWDLSGFDQELLFMATVKNQGVDEVLASKQIVTLMISKSFVNTNLG